MEILLALALGFGGGWYLHDPSPIDCKNDALIISSCPPLTRLDDPSFGGFVLKLQEVAGQYNECRTSCLPAPTAE